MERKEKFDQVKYMNDYNRKHYARLNLAIPPEVKDEIIYLAKAAGYRSITEYILSMLPLTTYEIKDGRDRVSTALLDKKEG